MTKLRVALVGCGGRGQGHLRILQRFEDVEIAAVCDPDQAARERVGEAFGVTRRYADATGLLESEKLDAVFVAAPAHLNAVAALPFLQRGINTLLEKPPGLSVKETRALRDAAAQTGAKAMVGWNRRFHPIITQARALVTARGPVTQLVGEFHKSIAQLEKGGRFPEVLMDNMFMETPIHALDIVRAIAAAEVTEVHSVVRRASSRYKDVHGALISFENGCLAQLIANYTTDARLERYEIHGHGISAYLEGVSQGVVFCDGKRHELSGAGDGGTTEQNRYFIDCVKADKPIQLPAANLDEAVKTMQLAEAILGGLRTV